MYEFSIWQQRQRVYYNIFIYGHFLHGINLHLYMKLLTILICSSESCTLFTLCMFLCLILMITLGGLLKHTLLLCSYCLSLCISNHPIYFFLFWVSKNLLVKIEKTSENRKKEINLRTLRRFLVRWQGWFWNLTDLFLVVESKKKLIY